MSWNSPGPIAVTPRASEWSPLALSSRATAATMFRMIGRQHAPELASARTRGSHFAERLWLHRTLHRTLLSIVQESVAFSPELSRVA